jgi:hypothetical protein
LSLLRAIDADQANFLPGGESPPGLGEINPERVAVGDVDHGGADLLSRERRGKPEGE